MLLLPDIIPISIQDANGFIRLTRNYFIIRSVHSQTLGIPHSEGEPCYPAGTGGT